MEKLFELSFQDQTLNPQVGTFTDASQTTGTFTLEDGEYYLTNADTKGFYAYSPVAMQSGIVDDSKVIIEFDLKVTTASANTHTIIGTYAGVDGSGIPTGDKITLQYNAGDIELVLGGGATATLIESADVVVDQWYHFRIDCTLAAPLASTYQVKIDGVSVTTVTGATTDYALGVISVLGTDLHACDECGIKNITFVTETNMYVGRTALDQALKDVKNYVDSSGSGSYIPLAGTNALAGSIVPSTDNSYDFGSSSYKLRYVYCDTAYVTNLNINGTAAGDILTHNASEFVPRSGGAVISGSTIGRIDSDSYLNLCGGVNWNNGATISVCGKDSTNNTGVIILHPKDTTQEKNMWLKPNGTWTWDGTACQITSDQRLKQQITEIDDKLLDAWEDVDLVQFKYNDAVDQKGDNARLHTGYVVQQIDNACKEHGVDVSAYGLYCHEEYPEETEEVETEQADGTKTKETKVIREASEHYSLRYTEIYAVECMYLRRCIQRLTARIEELEKGKEASK